MSHRYDHDRCNNEGRQNESSSNACLMAARSLGAVDMLIAALLRVALGSLV
jgi:hypothetical protein